MVSISSTSSLLFHLQPSWPTFAPPPFVAPLQQRNHWRDIQADTAADPSKATPSLSLMSIGAVVTRGHGSRSGTLVRSVWVFFACHHKIDCKWSLKTLISSLLGRHRLLLVLVLNTSTALWQMQLRLVIFDQLVHRWWNCELVLAWWVCAFFCSPHFANFFIDKIRVLGSLSSLGCELERHLMKWEPWSIIVCAFRNSWISKTLEKSSLRIRWSLNCVESGLKCHKHNETCMQACKA